MIFMIFLILRKVDLSCLCITNQNSLIYKNFTTLLTHKTRAARDGNSEFEEGGGVIYSRDLPPPHDSLPELNLPAVSFLLVQVCQSSILLTCIKSFQLRYIVNPGYRYILHRYIVHPSQVFTFRLLEHLNKFKFNRVQMNLLKKYFITFEDYSPLEH